MSSSAASSGTAGRPSFEEPNALYFDNGSPQGRICVVGFSVAANLLLVVYVEAGERIRIVSARRPTRKERLLY